MSCFSCSPRTPRRKATRGKISSRSISRLVDSIGFEDFDKQGIYPDQNSTNKFRLRQLAIATKNFSQSNWIGQGGFGSVYRGRLDSGQSVAIKQLKQNGDQGTQEFVVECLMLMMLHHLNLVRLIGYCAEGDERILVYEFMSQGSLEKHLFNLPPNKTPLDWNTRMKIAVGAARGLTYLHSVNPPVIYRDLKSANILLDSDFNPRLSDFGLAKLGPTGDNTHVSTRVMGTYGYCAPDYLLSGKLNVKSDVFSFGVVLLELVTGRKVYDVGRPVGEQSLTAWSRPLLNSRGCMHLADPLLNGRYPHRPLYQLAEVITHCLVEQAHMRPSMTVVTSALEHIAAQPYDPSVLSPRPNRKSSIV